MSITKAIIPVAGWGTRRLPITKTIEKCMLPIGNRPLVDYVVQDCIDAGIRDIYFVVSAGSSQLQSYYSENQDLADYLRKNGKEDRIPAITPPEGVTFHYLVQDAMGKYGTTIPVSLAVPYLDEGESAVVLMGDDFIYNRDGSSEVRRLIEAAPEGGSAMLGVRVGAEQLGKYGVLELDEDHHFVRIVEKPASGEAPSDMINVSKYVLDYVALQQIQAHANTEQNGEYYITDPINTYVANGGTVKVIAANGEYLDGGSVEGWLHANKVVHGATAQL